MNFLNRYTTATGLVNPSQELLDNASPLDCLLHNAPNVSRLNPSIPDTLSRQWRRMSTCNLELFRQVNDYITRKRMAPNMAYQRHF